MTGAPFGCGFKRGHQNAVRASLIVSLAHDPGALAGEVCVGAVIGCQTVQVRRQVNMQAEAQAEP